ncbi:hypothetical protein GX50_03660 [[Emmonsia] crescens]|uniref:Uncharacterized protein n=1 Tax=[Emmonsia] crescens TaxID=73230 RepID=A0A2B7ZAN8_9EURO|nr:hypothetical protein GX50_03660 [Emmonsia crescens]
MKSRSTLSDTQESKTGGMAETRPESLVPEVNGIIYMVNANDPGRFQESKDKLHAPPSKRKKSKF